MPDHQRIDDLRRRIEKDPASIAFAQLAEECRRAGRYEEAVDVCHAGLSLHPGYLSARVTLGRALIELNELEAALEELATVLKSAPENLAAIRGVADIHHRRNELPAALAQYRAALALARNDPDLQRTVDELAREIEPPPAAKPHEDGLSFEQMHAIFGAAPPARPEAPASAMEAVDVEAAKAASEPAEAEEDAARPSADCLEVTEDTASPAPIAPEIPETPSAPSADVEPRFAASSSDTTHQAAPTVVELQVAALEQWLAAIHVARGGHGS